MPHHFLLVVDQFEELFSLCRSEAERKAFVDNLLFAAGSLPLPSGEGSGNEGGPPSSSSLCAPTFTPTVRRSTLCARHCARGRIHRPDEG